MAAPASVRYWFEEQLGQALIRLSPRQGGGPLASHDTDPRSAGLQPPDKTASAGVPRSRSPQQIAITPQHAATVIPLRDGASPMYLLPGQSETPASAAPAEMAVTGCSLPEAAQIFNQCNQNVSIAQVFFELGHGAPTGGERFLRVLSAAEVMRAAHLPDGQHLLACLITINRAFQQLRGRSDISLFGMDQIGHLYIHEATCQSIRRLWDELVAAEADELRRGGLANHPAAPEAAEAEPAALA